MNVRLIHAKMAEPVMTCFIPSTARALLVTTEHYAKQVVGIFAGYGSHVRSVLVKYFLCKNRGPISH